MKNRFICAEEVAQELKRIKAVCLQANPSVE